MNFLKIIFLIGSFFVFGIYHGQDFEVAPVVINFDANPGEIQKSKITIRNHGNVSGKYTLTTGDFKILEDGEKERVAAGSTENSCANWLTLTPSFVELNPNESKEITVLMTVPKGENDTKWCMVYAQPADEQTENPVDKQMATGIKVVPRIAVLINQSPKSNTNYKAKIGQLKNISMPEDEFYTFEVPVINNGGKIVEANVHIEIGNMTTLEQQKFDGKMQRVYPGEKKMFELSIPKSLSSGKYAVGALLNYGHESALEVSQLLLDVK